LVGYIIVSIESLGSTHARGLWFGLDPYVEWGRGLCGFEPTISAGERPQTYALDRAATGTGIHTHTHTHTHIYIYIYIERERERERVREGGVK